VVLDEARFLEDGGSSRVISIGLSNLPVDGWMLFWNSY
jgi:hypothetical protein